MSVIILLFFVISKLENSILGKKEGKIWLNSTRAQKHLLWMISALW